MRFGTDELCTDGLVKPKSLVLNIFADRSRPDKLQAEHYSIWICLLNKYNIIR